MSRDWWFAGLLIDVHNMLWKRFTNFSAKGVKKTEFDAHFHEVLVLLFTVLTSIRPSSYKAAKITYTLYKVY